MRDLLRYSIGEPCILHAHSPSFETSGLLLAFRRSICGPNTENSGHFVGCGAPLAFAD
jgi:hypothetical protein